MTQSENWLQQCPSVAVAALKTCQLWRRKYWISTFPPFSHSKIFFQRLIFQFVPSSAFLRFWKALEQDAMSSSVSIVRRRKFLNTCDVWFFCIIISYVMFFSYANFQHSQKASLLWTPLRHAFPGMFLKSFKTLAAGVLSGLKLLAFGSWFYTR